MAKKHWIYIKRGLSEDAKHRAQMGECVWLYMHIIDRADWETGIAYDWKDAQEAADMSLPLETLRKQRQKLEKYDYIRCEQNQHSQDVRIMEWRNPRDYGSEVKNPRIEGGGEPQPSEIQGGSQDDRQGQGSIGVPPLESDSDSLAEVKEKANKKVDAILDQVRNGEGKVSYPKREALPEPIRELIDEFVRVSGMKPLAKDVSGWLMAGQDWLNLNATKDDVRKSLEYAKGKFTISSPASLTNTIRSYKTGNLAGMQEHSETDSPAYVAPPENPNAMTYAEWQKTQAERESKK